jgi:hypothetical protein
MRSPALRPLVAASSRLGSRGGARREGHLPDEDRLAGSSRPAHEEVERLDRRGHRDAGDADLLAAALAGGPHESPRGDDAGAAEVEPEPRAAESIRGESTRNDDGSYGQGESGRGGAEEKGAFSCRREVSELE